MTRNWCAALLGICLVLFLGSCVSQGGAATESAEAQLVLHWYREGGIVGYCDSLFVYADGSVVASTCTVAELSTKLTSQERRTVEAWQERFLPFDMEQGSLDSPDALLERIEFVGEGSELPDAEEFAQMKQLAQALLQRATGG